MCSIQLNSPWAKLTQQLMSRIFFHPDLRLILISFCDQDSLIIPEKIHKEIFLLFYMRLTLLMYSVTTLLSCASQMTVQSTPNEASVSISSIHPSLKDGVPVEVGKTPLQVKTTELQTKLPQGPYIVQIKHEGYEPLSFLIPDIGAADLALNLQMQKTRTDEKVNVLVDGLFKAQAYTHNGDYQSAITLLTNLEKDFENVSAIYEMKASIYILQKNIPSALTSADKAIKLNPNNEELKSFYRILTKDRNISSFPEKEKERQ